MKRNRVWTLLVCFVMIAALLCGCGAGSAQESADYYAMAETMPATEAAMEAEGGISSDTALSDYSDPNAKLIRTVHLDAQTQEYDSLIRALDEKIAALGGYVENRDAYNGSEYYGYSNRYCHMVIRIPADRLDEFVTHVNDSCNVISTNETVENITLQYVDTASRVEALETEQERLMELLEDAQNLTEILEIEARLSDVGYELSSYASQLRVMDNQVSYATVRLNIDEVEKLTPTEEPTVWERIRDGFINTLEDVADGAVNLFVWFVVNSPVLVIWAVVVAVVIITVKAIRSRRKAKKKAASAPMTPPEEKEE